MELKITWNKEEKKALKAMAKFFKENKESTPPEMSKQILIVSEDYLTYEGFNEMVEEIGNLLWYAPIPVEEMPKEFSEVLKSYSDWEIETPCSDRFMSEMLKSASEYLEESK